MDAGSSIHLYLAPMSQITIYLPSETERRVRAEARRARLSVSAYIARLVGKPPRRKAWPASFLKTWGAWEGELERPSDPPPQERDEL
jgi:hypothetical protein